MQKAFMFCLFTILLCGCIKNNSVVPITALQEEISGTWQVDSLVTVNAYIYSPYPDSTYKNHFVNITNTGNIVHVQMQGSDIMNYTISGNSLTPYYRRASGGCGMPSGGASFKVTPHTLQLIVTDGQITTTYMHR